ncbi:bifunctional 2-polyprenyl-6-hydroxyphenol methylase/3-demethylubiquinol 3-O-methyltransferase UbiG [Synechococcus sp. M16.1]|uniref:class I SAM-dependent methyltransferase n=1 Tax=Synechococcus sp. M16.1 TaxID=1442553 RepID=UPI001646634E|nr:class I SAM-dependent methyltransferase [Synechococcus sp. M16.1]QNJ12216.1 methyltransferase domain protein [Synechococcus sp. M16.1]
MSRLYQRLISSLPEVYQPIILKDKVLASGLRNNCEDRFNAISHLIGDNQTILDIGSNAGYFSIKIANEFKNSLIVSVESSPHYANLQRQLITDSKISNIVLINASMNLNWLDEAYKACVYFDHVLVLSVIHHFDQPRKVLKALSKVCKSIIIEMPHAEEKDVCGKKGIESIDIDFMRQLKPYFKKLTFESDIHTDDNRKRCYYHCYENEYERKAYYPYIGYPYSQRKYEIRSNKELKYYKHHLDKEIEATPGINLVDCYQLGPILSPNTRRIFMTIRAQIDELSKGDKSGYGDIRPWNIVLGSRGPFLIDYIMTNDLNPSLKLSRDRDIARIGLFLIKKHYKLSLSFSLPILKNYLLYNIRNFTKTCVSYFKKIKRKDG